MAADTDVKEVRLPTPQELQSAWRALHDATQAVGMVAFRVNDVVGTVDDEGDPAYAAPTFETIGRLRLHRRRLLAARRDARIRRPRAGRANTDDAFSRLDEMREYVDHVREGLTTLAEIQERRGTA